eukprot:1321097-Amorphochlora_amoeboformis.AAC.2
MDMLGTPNYTLRPCFLSLEGCGFGKDLIYVFVSFAGRDAGVLRAAGRAWTFGRRYVEERDGVWVWRRFTFAGCV